MRRMMSSSSGCRMGSPPLMVTMAVPRRASWSMRSTWSRAARACWRVELVAVGAGQVAAAHGDDVRHDDVVGIDQSMGDHSQLPHTAVGGDPFHRKPCFLCDIDVQTHYITRPAREGKDGVPKGAIPAPKGEVLHWAGMSMMEFHPWHRCGFGQSVRLVYNLNFALLPLELTGR